MPLLQWLRTRVKIPLMAAKRFLAGFLLSSIFLALIFKETNDQKFKFESHRCRERRVRGRELPPAGSITPMVRDGPG